MTVSITSKFYQASAWKDINKIVFTSPNMDSPQTAGLRSHILPGQGNLGLWYEDMSNMYRIEDEQLTTDTSFCSITMKNKTLVDLTASPTYIDVYDSSMFFLDEYIKDKCACTVLSYDSNINSQIISNSITQEYYTDSECSFSYIYLSSYSPGYQMSWDPSYCTYTFPTAIGYTYTYIKIAPTGLVLSVVPDIPICELFFTFENSVNIRKVYFRSVRMEQYGSNDYYLNPMSLVLQNTDYLFIGNFEFYGSNDESSWTLLDSDSNTTNSTKTLYLSDNASFYKYYKLKILNNDSLSSDEAEYDTGYSGTFDTDFYGIGSLTFYTVERSDSAGTEDIMLYEISDLDDVKVIKINGSYNRPGDAVTTSGTTNHTVEGEVTITTVSGTEDYGLYGYSIALNSILDASDYVTNANCISTTMYSGIGVVSASDSNGTTTLTSDLTSVSDYASVTFNTISGVGTYLNFSLTGSTSTSVDTLEYSGTNNYTYSTTASGLISLTVGTYDLDGNTARTLVSSLSEKRESVRLLVDEVTTQSGTISADSEVVFFDPQATSVEMDINDSIVFELTNGEAYNCRLTAWDDVTHSTTSNELISNDHVKVSAIAYCCTGSKLTPTTSNDPISLVYPPAYNIVLKGDYSLGDTKYYYGDFDMIYRTDSSVYGDFLIFKPMLYGIHSGISYGVHDFYITLHYSYT